MSIKKVCDKVRKGIEEGLYTKVRLCRLIKKGSKVDSEILITFNRPGKDHCLQRLKNIEFELNNGLEPGKYLIQATTGQTNTSLKKNFEVEVFAPIKIQSSYTVQSPSKGDENVQDYTKENSVDSMTLEDYRKTLEQMAELKAENRFLKMENDMLTRENQRLANIGPMDDAGNGNMVLDTLREFAPSVMGAVEKFLEQRDRDLTLRENSQNKVPFRKPSSKKQEPTYDDMVNYIDSLFATDDDKANEELDKIEEKDPQLYQYICTKLGLETDESEE